MCCRCCLRCKCALVARAPTILRIIELGWYCLCARCDALCTQFNDCCPDVDDICTTCTPDLCGSQAPQGCWCDDLCTFYNDCCDDVTDDCGIIVPEPSCEGFCGGFAGTCWCDNLCVGFADCCPDATDLCPDDVNGGNGTPDSCVDSCGQNAGQCWCDDLCTFYVDCCEDATSLCDLPGGCASVLAGDANSDSTVDILDVVSTVNSILSSGGVADDPCAQANMDINGDGTIDILDVVGIVNSILASP